VCFAARQRAPLVRLPAEALFAAQASRSNPQRAASAPIGPAPPCPWAPDPPDFDRSDFAPLASRAPLALLGVDWPASFAPALLRR
jgi:hypothetical protein